MSTNAQPSEASRRHLHRKTQARMQLVGILVLVAIGFAFFFAFLFSPGNRWPALKGPLMGSAVAVVLLLGATWSRQFWARYVLIVGLLVLAGIFGMCLLGLMTNPADANSPNVRTLGIGITCLIVADAWLVLSKRIRYLTTPAGSGGRS